jgi:hypothetical protein
MESKQIYKSLAAINKGITAIGKGQKNQQQGFQYRGIDDVMNELHSLFAENEVIILPEFQSIDSTERTTQKGGVLFYVKATIKFTFVASDGSSVQSVIVGEAMDSGDKATNKAMSIALKYALLQMFLIPTKEDKDPDAVTPPEIKPNPTELDDAIFAVEIADNLNGLEAVWNGYKNLHKNSKFIEAVKQAKVKILKEKS